MKTKCITFLSIIFILCSCGLSRSTGKDRIAMNSFNKIISASGAHLCFKKSNSSYVEIESGSNVAVEVKDGTLIFNRRGKRASGKDKSTVYIYGNNIEAVILSGGSGFKADDIKISKPFSIAASGGSEVCIKRLNIDDCNLTFSGNANCDIKHLRSKRINIATSGGSDANINIDKADNTNVASSGNSDVTLSGKTQNVSLSVSGGSAVNIINLKYDHLNTHQSKSGSIRK